MAGRWAEVPVRLVICVELDVCGSPPQGYVNPNVTLWADIDFGLSSTHFTCAAFYRHLEDGLLLSLKYSSQRKHFRHCNLA